MIRTRTFAPWVTRHAYWIAVLLPLLLPLCWAVRELPGWSALFAWLPLLVLYVLIPLFDLLIGRDLHNPEIHSGRFYPDTLIPVAAAACFLAVLFWAVGVAPQVLSGHGWSALAGWLFSLGNIGGAVGINVAHELIHRRSRAMRLLGGLLLSSVWYPGFKLEHPRWHHVHVATPDDPSSAARGQTVYRQVPRAWVLNTVQAWKLGLQEARARNRRWPLLFNETAGWYALSLSLTLAAGFTWGSVAAFVLVGQGVIAALLLEIINYVEHYGLQRARRADGRFVPPGVAHSWDCDFWLSNALLIQLPRHADHHTHPRRCFSSLRKNAASPLLPLGYPLLVLITLVPPLWRHLIHPLVPEPAPFESGSG